MEFSFITPPNLLIHWDCWGMEGRNKKALKGLWLIWHTTVWVVWQVRNNKIFKDEVCGIEEIVEKIKVLSWRWSLTRLKIPTCMFYEWCWNPNDCLRR